MPFLFVEFNSVGAYIFQFRLIWYIYFLLRVRQLTIIFPQEIFEWLITNMWRMNLRKFIINFDENRFKKKKNTRAHIYILHLKPIIIKRKQNSLFRPHFVQVMSSWPFLTIFYQTSWIFHKCKPSQW